MSTTQKKGHLHPITHTLAEMTDIFYELGFEFAEGPEVETGENNFDSLNVPKDHPARDLQDTFWLKNQPGHLLRTQTSAHQVPYMKTHEPPIKMITHGRVFRNEATDTTHEVQFYQLEGLSVGKKGLVTMADLKGTLFQFLTQFFGDREMRMRPGYFPFVEPGVEVDIKYKGKWIEVLGAGMVHPNVLKSADLSPEKYGGFAFGVGVDRLVMIRYGIDDVRLLYSGDMRLINQF